MANEQSRITVVGQLRRVDIAVPSTAPIGEYAPQLAELCGQAEPDVMPAAWSLAGVDGQAYPLDASLQDLGVVDGQVLYLRDVTREPGEAPVVKDIDEVVADESAAQRRARPGGGPVVLSFGLAWLAAAAVLIGRASGLSAPSVTVVVLVLVALALFGVGWGLQQKPSTMPETFVHLVVLGALPCLTVAGLLAGGGLGGPDYRWIGAIAGANLAALMGLALVPGVVLAAVEVQLFVAAVVALLLLGLEADRNQAMALVAAVAVAMLAGARRTSAMLTSWGVRRPRGRSAAAEATNELVRDSNRFLAVVVAGPTAALALALPPLAVSGEAFSVATAIVVSAALLARARQAAVTGELLATAGAGLVGLFALIVGVTQAGAADVLVAALLLVAGLLVVGVGVAMAYLIPSKDDQIDAATVAQAPRKRSRAEVVGVVTGLAIAPLTLGVLGVFEHLIAVGRSLF
ncbi:EsaB/YukD family protein [Micromonospora sp. NPDC007208]|uniref:EsaB/YukD family protein n=1 Tax=Micromonospora sp. NPDC007208 TaxID=3364236 RepID=UPI00369071E6